MTDYRKCVAICKSSPDGYFEGYASVFNEVDDQLDCMQRGAFVYDLAKYKSGTSYPGMYLNHNPSIPLGKWLSIQEDNYGLHVKGQLLFDLPMSLSVHALMQRMSMGLSVGIQIQKSSIINQVRYIHQAELCEISLTKRPANSKARIFI